MPLSHFLSAIIKCFYILILVYTKFTGDTGKSNHQIAIFWVSVASPESLAWPAANQTVTLLNFDAAASRMRFQLPEFNNFILFSLHLLSLNGNLVPVMGTALYVTIPACEGNWINPFQFFFMSMHPQHHMCWGCIVILKSCPLLPSIKHFQEKKIYKKRNFRSAVKIRGN